MLTDRSDRAMVEMIHHVGQVMGKATIAEAVENEAIADALCEIGVHYGQGNGFGLPAPFDASFRLTAAAAGEPVDQRRFG
jgi:EAL domain-containing protein (putative c-di-GMP-specific phosphodiesterase class I)